MTMTMLDSSWAIASPIQSSRVAVVKKSKQSNKDEFPLGDRPLSDASMLMQDAKRQFREIGEVGALGEAHEDLAQWTYALLREIANNSSVYPSIAPDYCGGLALHWVANHLSLEIEVDSNKSYAFVAYNHDEVVAHGEGTGQPPIERLKAHLTLLTRYVEVNNPAWRERVV